MNLGSVLEERERGCCNVLDTVDTDNTELLRIGEGLFGGVLALLAPLNRGIKGHWQADRQLLTFSKTKFTAPFCLRSSAHLVVALYADGGQCRQCLAWPIPGPDPGKAMYHCMATIRQTTQAQT